MLPAISAVNKTSPFHKRTTVFLIIQIAALNTLTMIKRANLSSRMNKTTTGSKYIRNSNSNNITFNF